MAATRGWLDNQGCPLATIEVFPEGRPGAAKNLDALIDTGFTAFAQVPARLAASVGLTAVGEMEITYPDNTTEPVPVAWTSVRLGARGKGSCSSRAR
jgi:predicted aspartyl protease